MSSAINRVHVLTRKIPDLVKYLTDFKGLFQLEKYNLAVRQ
jgi:hypothetical protein